MDTVKVKKDELIAQLKQNRTAHKANYEEANTNYRQKVVDTMRERATAIEGGGEIETYFDLPKPEDHTDDYDKVLTMLDWHQEDEVELEQSQFEAYVRNKWHWERAFAQNTMSYTASGRR